MSYRFISYKKHLLVHLCSWLQKQLQKAAATKQLQETCDTVADMIIYTSVKTYWGLLNTYWYKLCLKCSKYDGLWLTKCFTVTAGNIYALPCVTESENKTTTSYNIFVYYKTLPFVTQYYRSHFHVGRRWPLFS